MCFAFLLEFVSVCGLKANSRRPNERENVGFLLLLAHPAPIFLCACECECVYVQCPLDLKLQQDTESVFGDYILVRGEGCWNPVYLVQPSYGSRWDL